MSTIAVAGGTGGIGKTIVEALLQEPKYRVIVLTQSSPKEDPVLKQTQQIQINYNDLDPIVETLEKHAVHTIISAIGIYTDEAAQSQMNLVQAAEKSSVTKRFVPSEYSFIQTEDLLPHDPSIKYWLDAAELLKKTKLQYTRVCPGVLMDYWGMPRVRTNIHQHIIGIDILDLEEWPEFSIFAGDDTTYNELLKLAEEARRKQFDVVYDSAENIKAGRVTVPPFLTGLSEEEAWELTVLVSRLTIAGAFDLPQERMNALFPDVKPIKMREFLINTWKDGA
ncbi:uncharacterized protein BO87DRAFT_398541 [Aspergillus neoniger CBS 115656]|uniref:NmrA-like family protein n=1 Tax=Aspergillus neoniger (strain CBS 115656) TaxID=1448310 RepID=A0A318YXW3_ASPNB|nr:NmrA-like family protein [Aspergillus neoniger CBS 115656]PYH32688.1 NmrA-like family protein [Aspergillus neoniger CBS 115656]